MIHNEDCQTTMKNFSSSSIDVVMTSPPYNMTPRKGGDADTGRYDKYDDWKSVPDYLDWTSSLFSGFSRILKSDGVVLYNFSYSIENPSLPYKLVSEIESTSDFILLDTIIWKKSAGMPFPANKERLSRNWEYVFVFAKQKNIKINKKVSSVSKKTGQSYYETIYNFIQAKNNDKETRGINQATFSTDLVMQLLNIYAVDDSTVYDPFSGTGTTMLACQMLNRGLICHGSEISETQCKYTHNRLEQASSHSTFRIV